MKSQITKSEVIVWFMVCALVEVPLSCIFYQGHFSFLTVMVFGFFCAQHGRMLLHWEQLKTAKITTSKDAP